ncbi:PD-(D/E)XK nuclease-like domain-containing protein [Hoeflea sp. TYP-13]|uniref:PD-(D/E)XK nuclease-like domain-containing protein n=1 Tax=Hoeflea sp. TYP-13 TaxID=3230023 RepID=UPI0034C64515
MDIDRDQFESAGDIAASMIAQLSEDKRWDGETPISEPGVYVGISLEDYHDNTKLLDGPSVSKSSLMRLAPPLGNPKKFWSFWAHNPNRIEEEPNKAMNFGRAVHALLLGDEVFAEKFVKRLDKAPDGRAWNANNLTCRAWLKEQAEIGRTVITSDQLEQIKRMAEDAAQYDLVRMGLLNGRVERSMFWEHPSGIWLKSRPDVIPTDSGMFADLKTTGDLDSDFLERQNGANGYYLQAALTRMICRGLSIPFESFTIIYSLSKEYGDTDHRDVSDFDMDRGEKVIDYCMHKIREGLDTGIWEGARTYVREERPLHLKQWTADQIDHELKRFDKETLEAAE